VSLSSSRQGLGKTLQVLALIAASLKQNVSSDGASGGGVGKLTLNLKSKVLNPKRIAPTLIVCPLSVITNWEQQVLHHFAPSQLLTHYTYHGPNRLRDCTQLRQYDIIITTYNILSQEYDASCAALGLEDSSESEDDDDAPFKALKKKVVKKKKNKKRIDAAQAAASAAAAAVFQASDELESAEPRRAPLFEIDFFRIILVSRPHTMERRDWALPVECTRMNMLLVR
jgi:SNF2 family DNA or RNA helicase